ncbi:hypothetical protein [Flavisolibacter ginsengisoli]|uniref:Uncharacterized protein n=1 Tax=Flavisolibacter ginsengisoli DSM 18119 TaxID=1121884 RepID=A0A1M5GQ06_9BACT|nr:hypothetical protein [Flavisolibacter ginsengisoli]SHG05835.1 hypothetical protein SAMN02745131_04203 [Flavisolibacter ginsengisoli DSM 18119]
MATYSYIYLRYSIADKTKLFAEDRRNEDNTLTLCHHSLEQVKSILLIYQGAGNSLAGTPTRADREETRQLHIAITS